MLPNVPTSSASKKLLNTTASSSSDLLTTKDSQAQHLSCDTAAGCSRVGGAAIGDFSIAAAGASGTVFARVKDKKDKAGNATTDKSSNHHGNRYTCDICNMICASKYSLHRHKEAKHSDERRFIVCDICGRPLLSRFSLTRHKKMMHSDDRKFKCSICNTSFKTRDGCFRHEKIHRPVKDFLCYKCGKQFIEKSLLESHLLTHSGNRLFKCGICSDTLTNKRTFAAHMSLHSDSPRTCEECGRCFVNKTSLARHKMTHSDESFCACFLCDKDFTTMKILKTHIRIKHSDSWKKMKFKKTNKHGNKSIQVNTDSERKGENTGSERKEENTGSERKGENTGSERKEENIGSECEEENTGSERKEENTGSEREEENTGSECEEENTGSERKEEVSEHLKGHRTFPGKLSLMLRNKYFASQKP